VRLRTAWVVLLEDCRARLHCLREALEIETKRETGVRLKQNYAEKMPEIVATTKNGRVKQVAVRRTRGKQTNKRASKRTSKTRSKRQSAS